MSQRKAFSLLEIMIVLVLMAGIIAIAWPSISRPMRKAELSEATQKLREAIEDGRYQAMVAGAPVFLQIKQGESEIRSGGMESLLSGELDRDNDEADVGAGRSSYVDGNMSKPQEHAQIGRAHV